VSSLFATIALFALLAAGLSSLVSWQRGAALAAPWVVVGVMGAVVAGMPWAQWAQSMIKQNLSADTQNMSCVLLVLVGHVALVGWLLARRFFPRFTDERARARARRAVDQDRGRR
jgi:hypothetical protein